MAFAEDSKNALLAIARDNPEAAAPQPLPRPVPASSATVAAVTAAAAAVVAPSGGASGHVPGVLAPPRAVESPPSGAARDTTQSGSGAAPGTGRPPSANQPLPLELSAARLPPLALLEGDERGGAGNAAPGSPLEGQTLVRQQSQSYAGDDAPH